MTWPWPADVETAPAVDVEATEREEPPLADEEEEAGSVRADFEPWPFPADVETAPAADVEATQLEEPPHEDEEVEAGSADFEMLCFAWPAARWTAAAWDASSRSMWPEEWAAQVADLA